MSGIPTINRARPSECSVDSENLELQFLQRLVHRVVNSKIGRFSTSTFHFRYDV